MTDVLIGAAVALLTGMGVGGGGLLLIFLTLIRDFDIRSARVMGLLFFILSAGAALPYHKKQRRIPWRYVWILTVSAVPGVLLGNFLTEVLSPDVIRTVFGGFLMLAGGWGVIRQLRQKCI